MPEKKGKDNKIAHVLFINGPDLSNREYILAYNVNNYKNAYLDSNGICDSRDRYFPFIRKYFWTHDWIAESATIILGGVLNNSFLYKLSHDIKFYYLLGSEAPDINQDSNRSQEIKLIDSRERIYGSRSLYGPTKYGTPGNTPYQHHVHFDIDGKRVEKRDAVRGAEWSYILASKSLNQEEYEKAAFFMGSMVHYIGDICGYPHLYNNPNNGINSFRTTVKSATKSFWAKVGCLTCKPERFRGKHDFFNLDDVCNMFYKCKPKSNGYNSALFTANEINKNKEFLHEAWGYKGDLWPKDRRECLNWTQNDWNFLSNIQYEYFTKIKDCLDIAIYSCAAAFHNLLSAIN